MQEFDRNLPHGTTQSIIRIPHPQHGHVEFANPTKRQKDILAHYTAIVYSNRKKYEHKN